MDSTEQDLLASLYLDGEATPNEVALVEGDPDLMARVNAFRLVQAHVGAPTVVVSPPVKERHLSAALDLFDSTAPELSATATRTAAPSGQASAHAVVDLTERRTRPATNVPPKQSQRVSLLATAAGFMVLLVGGVFVASQVDGDSTTETASVEIATAADDAMEEAAEAANDAMEEAAEDTAERADGAAATSAAQAVAGGADEDAAEEAEVPESDDAEEAFAVAAEEEAAADAPLTTTTPSTPTTLPEIRRDSLPAKGFFPQDPVVVYPTQPSGQDLINDLTLAWRDADSSLCADAYQHPDDALLIAYLPVEITAGPDGQPQIQEALYFALNNNVEVVLVERETCEAV